MTTADQALDALVDAILPRLAARGVVIQNVDPGDYSDVYDEATCVVYVSSRHVGDSVLARMQVFFAALADDGQIASLDLVARLGLKGATSVPANLTNSMKKRARKLGLPVPWKEGTTPDGTRTVWFDRDGIAARMVKAIDDELARRGLQQPVAV